MGKRVGRRSEHPGGGGAHCEEPNNSDPEDKIVSLHFLDLEGGFVASAAEALPVGLFDCAAARLLSSAKKLGFRASGS
jgi:hypothetical protein